MAIKNQRKELPLEQVAERPMFGSHKNVEELDREEWNPTRQEFEAFMVRDEELAFNNVQHVLKCSDREITFRDLRDCLLHSVETVEYVLDQLIKRGVVKENKNRFALAA